MLSRSEEVSVDVNKDDQERINQFSCKTNEVHELEVELAAKKEEIEALEDAVSALYESEDETAPIMIGESLINLPRMDTIEKVEQLNDKAVADCEALESKIAELKKELAELKVVLYAKFKNSINLEED
uniref:Prefoldin subunit 4 n=1 Tax=Vannella robusta TaxID=1487602 RepID=A0A7S4I5K4_9EUKA|mmetsp:Transcript_20631/g.26091  ORF Transcript_20631/g.26091 Transcript_20631/m.26091 type:complete len:128 (+) Transcript_20631:39-422(+)